MKSIVDYHYTRETPVKAAKLIKNNQENNLFQVRRYLVKHLRKRIDVNGEHSENVLDQIKYAS